MTLDSILFFVLAGVAVISAILMVTRRNPVISAIYLILNFFMLSGLYLTLQAQFLAVIQILVYAGAIMVLFVFVIMLLNLSDEQRLAEGISYRKIIAVVLAIAMFLEVVYIVGFNFGGKFTMQSPDAGKIGTVEYIGTQLFTIFLFPFEITSLLLLAAIVGAIVLAKKKFE